MKKTPEEILLNELEILEDCYQSPYALTISGYKDGVADSAKLVKSYLTQCQQDDAERKLTDKIFDLANELAVAGYGNEARQLHSIHNKITPF